MTATDAANPDVIFLNLARVVAMAGVSKTEVYRLMAAGLFPRNRAFPHNPGRRFWLRSDIVRWQRSVIEATGGDNFDERFEELVE